MNSKSRHKLIFSAALVLIAPSLFGHAAIKAKPSLEAQDNSLLLPDGQPDEWSPETIARILDWQQSPDNICRGYYLEPDIVTSYPIPPDYQTQKTTITADQPVFFSLKGTSTLEGNVTVNQPGRQVLANRAYLNRDPETGKISTIDLVGDVHYRESGKLIVAKRSHIDLKNKFASLESAVYRFTKKTNTGILNAWGTLRSGERETSGILNLYHATYSTCPPTTDTWKVKADHLRLDRESGEGTATNTILDIKNVPVFYVPYFSFPIDDRRKTGFLFPTFSFFSPTNGNTISVPFYMNLAPNYDATYTPTLISKRGFQSSLLYRYLTETSAGAFNFDILPDDQVFQQFQQDAFGNFLGVPNEAVFLRHLENDSSTRFSTSYTNYTTFNEHWSDSLNLNYVSDDYYLQDFGNTPISTNADQLLNEADLNYQGQHWRFLGRFQGYQTLHPINEAPIQNQYNRLPELDLDGDYPNQGAGLDYELHSQLINFDQQRNFINDEPVVVGQRYHLEPGISLPLGNLNGYFKPEFLIDETNYQLSDRDLNLNQIGFPASVSRTLPIFDIDSGLFFDRKAQFFNQSYDQTLEPRIYYLYVPFTNQNDIPIFDTNLPPFNFSQLFQTNRFVGLDRIGDANQVSTALTSRFLDSYTGQQKLRMSLGEIFYLQKRKVCDDLTCADDPTINDNNSPIIGELQYNLNPAWSIISDLAWDANHRNTNNSDFNLLYNTDPRHIFTLGYSYVRDGDILNPIANPLVNNVVVPNAEVDNLSRVNVGAAWPITQSWSAIGDWNYNISHSHPQVYIYGAQYDACCWALRFLASRTITAESPNGQNQFVNEFYVQLQLKGLGNVGNNDPSSILASMLPGYQDIFS